MKKSKNSLDSSEIKRLYRAEKEKIEEALGIGADDYLIKSHFTPSEVMKKIHAFLKK